MAHDQAAQTPLEANQQEANQQTASEHSAEPDSLAEHSLAERFMRSLQQIEVTGEVEPLVALFAEDADAINLAMSEPTQGKQNIRQFWQHYLSVFDRIRSHFTHAAEGAGAIMLEWVSEGALSSGEPFRYRGVSILETEHGQVKHFRTYYDSAAFLPQGAK